MRSPLTDRKRQAKVLERESELHLRRREEQAGGLRYNPRDRSGVEND
jgi:hypothetical protein